MSKRKTMRKVKSATELKVGNRIAVVVRSNTFGCSDVRIGYVDSFSMDRTMVYVDYRWRGNRSGPWWNARDGQWDLVYVIDDYCDIYVTDKSLQQMCAAAQKHHPDWKWLRGL